MIIAVNLNNDSIVIQNHGILVDSNDQWIDVLVVVGSKNQIEVVVLTNDVLCKVGLDGCNNVVHILDSTLDLENSLCTFVEGSSQVILYEQKKLFHWLHNIIRWLQLSDFEGCEAFSGLQPFMVHVVLLE